MEKEDYDLLNKQITQKIFGGASMGSFSCPKCRGFYYGTDTVKNERVCHDMFNKECRWYGAAIDAIPRYSEDFSAAWEIVKHLLKEDSGCYFNLGAPYPIFSSPRSHLWEATFYKSIGYGETAALAICRAALELAKTKF